MKMKYFLGVLFTLIILMFSNIYAVELEELPLELKINNGSNQITNDRFTFEMIPNELDFPMPEETVDGKYTFSVDKEGIYNLSMIEFDTPGVYEYTVYQVDGKNPQYNYDKSKYTIIVTVVNSESSSDLEVSAIVTQEGIDGKYSTILFENTYYPPENNDNADTSDINLWYYILIGSISIFTLIGVKINKIKIKE